MVVLNKFGTLVLIYLFIYLLKLKLANSIRIFEIFDLHLKNI